MPNYLSISIVIIATAVTLIISSIVMTVSFYNAEAIGNRCPTVWQRSEGLRLCIGTDNNDHIDGSNSPDILVGLAD